MSCDQNYTFVLFKAFINFLHITKFATHEFIPLKALTSPDCFRRRRLCRYYSNEWI